MHIQNGEEFTRYTQRCPRHGARIRRFYGCPRCVVEVFQSRLRQFDTPCGCEKLVPAGSIYQRNAQLAETR